MAAAHFASLQGELMGSIIVFLRILLNTLMQETNYNTEPGKQARILTMRRLKWAVAVFLSGMIIAASIAIVVFYSRYGSDIAIETLNQYLSDNGDGPTVTGTIEFDLWSHGIRFKDLRFDFPGRGFIEIEEGLAIIRPVQFFLDRIIVERVQLTHPEIKWDLTKDVPKSADRKKIGWDLLEFPFDLEIHSMKITGGEVEIASGGKEMSRLTGINVESNKEDLEYRISLETSAGRLETEFASVAVNSVSANAVYADASFNLLNMKVILPETELAFSGHVKDVGASKGEMTFKLDLPLEKLSDSFHDLPRFKGHATVEALVRGDFDNPELSGRLSIKDGWVDDMRTEDSDLQFKVNGNGAWLDGSVFHFALGRIEVKKAELLFKEHYPIDVELYLHDVELAHILDNVTPLHSKVMQWHTGTVRMSGTLAPFKMEGVADLDVRGHSVHSVGYKIRRPDTVILEVPKSHVKVELFTDATCFEMRNGTAAFDDTVVGVNVVHFGFDSVFHMSYSSGKFHMLDVGKLVGLDIEGDGSLDCTIDIADDNCVINAWVDFADVSVNDFRLGDTRMDVGFKEPVLSFTDAFVRKNRSKYHADVAFNFNSEPVHLSISVGTDGIFVSDLIAIIKPHVNLGNAFRGRFAGNGDFHGPMGDFNGEAKFVFPEFSARGQSFDSAVFEARLEHNDLELKNLAVKKGEAGLWVKGSLNDWSDIDMHLYSEAWKMSDLDLLSFLFDEAKGTVTLKGRVVGALADPVMQADMMVSELTIGEENYPQSELHIELTPRYLDMNGFFFDRQVDYSALFQFTPKGVVQANVKMNEFRYPFVLDKLLAFKIGNGKVSGTARMEGPIRNLAKAEGRASISALYGEISNIMLSAEKGVEASYKDGLFRIEPVFVSGEDVAFETRGDIDLSGEMNVLLKGKTDLAQVVAAGGIFGDSSGVGIEDAQGPASFDFSLNGEWGDLRIIGQTTIQQATFVHRDLDRPVENLSGAIHFGGDRIHSESVRFDYAGGGCSLSGKAGYDQEKMELKGLDFRLDLDHVGFKLDEDMVPTLSGELYISGEMQPFKVQGRINIDEMSYTKDVRWQKKLLIDNLSRAIRPRKWRDVGDKKPGFVFEIDITGDDTISVRNNIANLKLRADLKLIGTELAPALLNTLSTDRGKIYFYNNEFEIIRFMWEFAETDRILPIFDVLAETKVTYIENEEEKEVRISMQLKGDMDNPEVVLTSDAGLSHNDIISLLWVGQLASKVKGEDSGMATGLNAISDIYGVNDHVRNRFKLDEFRLTSEYRETSTTGESNIVPKLVIGKEIADQVYITYATTVGEQETRKEQEFELKYQMKYFTVSTEWDNDSIEPQGNFGADLKFHIDF